MTAVVHQAHREPEFPKGCFGRITDPYPSFPDFRCWLNSDIN
jgi:hypothetical protein